MIWFHVRKMRTVAMAAAAMSCLTASEKLVAAGPDTAPNVTYTISGTFASPQISGKDGFMLRGEPFSISVVINAAMVPTSTGAHWAKYTKLVMTGTVDSGIQTMPVPISSNFAAVELANGNPAYDVLELFAPVTAFAGIQVNLLANIQLPPGTFVKPLAHPFAAVSLAPPDLGPTYTVTYSNSTGSTSLGIASGTIVATIPGGGAIRNPAAGVQLHAGGAEVITAHADGSKSVRSIGASPVELGASSDLVVLQFYASGVRDSSEIHVQIAGHDVPVLYTGPAGRFPGLDEVSVEVPRSLAGSGNVDVVMTVDGQAASPVHIQIQ
jgi:uncharacterized protein (TIGR03437 family)